MQSLQSNAYAKINLMLDVSGRRDDGYHTISSVMQTISLCDSIVVRKTRTHTVELGCNLPYLPRDARNLAVRAAIAFFDRADIHDRGLAIHMKKVIPVGAGMAGGSTDAATVLRLLNRLYGTPLSFDELLALGLTLGADVPFCMTGGAALATGIGEVLTPCTPMPNCFLVICKPPVSVSTKRAYELLDSVQSLEHPDHAQMISALQHGDLRAVCLAMGNSFQSPIENEKPVIGTIRTSLKQLGALGVMMTGSGSAVFGVFDDKASAQRAFTALRTKWRDVFLTTPLK